MNAHATNHSKPDHQWHGIWTAIVTPFSNTGAVEWDVFDKLLDEQATAGVKGVVVCGTTGEAPTLTNQEKLSLFRRARAQLPDSVRMMAGTGGNNTAQSVELSKLAEDAGADSLLIATPPYNKPSIAGLMGHFSAIAQGVNIPLVLYHVPGRTAQWLSIDDLTSLTKIEGVAAVKEASADVAYFSRAVLSTDVPILSGDDPTFLSSLAVGGAGAISVVSNIFPKTMVQMFDDFSTGKTAEALKKHNVLLPMIDALFCEANPGPTKEVLRHEGHGEGGLRQPLAPLTEENRQKVLSIYEETKKTLAK